MYYIVNIYGRVIFLLGVFIFEFLKWIIIYVVFYNGKEKEK